METFKISRLEAFVDGVFAIAITLLVLELDLPKLEGGNIAELIRADLPKFNSWLVSFFAVGTLWLHHHYAVTQLRAADVVVVILNLILLLFISVTPWTTSLIGAYPDQPIANVLFSGSLGLAWLMIALISKYARHNDLLRPEAPQHAPGFVTSMISLRGTIIAAVSIALTYLGVSWAVLIWLLLFAIHPFIFKR